MGELSWCSGNRREGFAVSPVPQTPPRAGEQYTSHLQGGWRSGELVKRTQGERFSTESSKAIHPKGLVCRVH